MTGGPGSLSLLQSAPPSSSRPDDAALKKDAGQLLDIPYSPLERSLFSPVSPLASSSVSVCLTPELV